MKSSRVAVFIGRFQPYHNAHKEVVEKALQDFDYLIVLIGSSHLPRTRKNPWFWNERVQMVIECHSAAEHRLFISPVKDNPEDDKAWAATVHGVVMGLAPPGSEITLVHGTRTEENPEQNKKLFPKWKHREYEIGVHRSGESIIEDYLSIPGSFEARVEADVPISTLAQMQHAIDGRSIEGIRASAV